jgi:hypothetical protein
LANQTCLDDTSPPGLSKGYVDIKKKEDKRRKEQQKE